MYCTIQVAFSLEQCFGIWLGLAQSVNVGVSLAVSFKEGVNYYPKPFHLDLLRRVALIILVSIYWITIFYLI